MKTKPEPGTRVRLTGDFLRNTGQIAGGEGPSRWTVQACDCGGCKLGRFVAVDQPSSTEFTAEELAREPGLALRHIAFANLEKAPC